MSTNPDIIPAYHHSPLSRPDNIRLLRLLPREQNSTQIRGELFEYSPRGKTKGTCLYEALSYVWGDENSSQSIIIDNHRLGITPNLQLALLHLRDDDFPRIIWVDAVCINQTNTKEKESQIPLISEIYARASRVLVWLGPARDDGDQALNAICRAGESLDELLSPKRRRVPRTASFEKRLDEYLEKDIEDHLSVPEKFAIMLERAIEIDSGQADISELLPLRESGKHTVLLEVERFKKSILQLLERPWFRRIWVLQEVAVAQNVFIMCGFTEINGHAFCLGLEALSRAYESEKFTNPVTFLIRGSIFRPPYASRNQGQRSLRICSLGELFDMYHSHETTVLHDKVYALVGMCSDDLTDAGLEPNYEITWSTLMKRLLHFLLSNSASVDAHDGKGVAVIRTKGCILGQVSTVKRGVRLSWKQKLEINIRDTRIMQNGPRSRSRSRFRSRSRPMYSSRMSESSEFEADGSGGSTWWALQTTANPIQEGDFLCFLQGASKPSIIRLQDDDDHFTIIAIAVTPPKYVKIEEEEVEWSTISRSMTFPRDFLLVWDWDDNSGNLQELGMYESLIQTRYLHSEDGLKKRLDKATRAWNVALILEDVGGYDMAQARFEEAIEGYESVLGKKSSIAAQIRHDSIATTERNSPRAQRTYLGPYGLTPLLWSALNGYKAVVRLLLTEHNIDVDYKDVRGNTALLYAAKNGHSVVVRLLLATGKVDVNAKDRNAKTPLLLAVRENHAHVVQLLLESGTTSTSKGVGMAHGSGRMQPPLDATYDRKDNIYEMKLKTKADVNAESNTGETPLLLAAKNNLEGIVKQLLATGEANVNQYAGGSDSKTSRASRRSTYIIGETAPKARGVDANVLDERNAMTALGYAAYYGNEAIVEMLLATGRANVDFGNVSTVQKGHGKLVRCQTPLSIASEKGHHAVVELLLGTGMADVNFEWEYRTPLSYAAANGHVSVVKLLLKVENIDVDCKDLETGRTALSYAAENGNLIIVEDLLATGRANVDSRDRGGRKPLRWAIAEGHEEVVKLLRDRMYQYRQTGTSQNRDRKRD